MTEIRAGQAPAPLTREQFQERFNVRFFDPAFDAERDAIARLEAIAWDALQEGRKAPLTRPAGTGFADPTYELSLQWLDTRARLQAAHWMGLIDAGAAAKLDRYIGYYEPYYNSHDALDADQAVQEEVRNVARSVVQAVNSLRAGRLSHPDEQIKWPRTK